MVNCEVCGYSGATESIERHTYFEINVPVTTCTNCGLIYTDSRAEEIIEKHVEEIRNR
jgi:uncharacterized Zn finger protein